MNPEKTLPGPPLISPAALAEKVAEHEKVLLMMDYDGTLVPIAPTPGQARPAGKLLKILAQLAQRPEYRLAVLSGRRLEELGELLPVPGLYLAGVHGAAIKKPDGAVVPLLKGTDTEKVIAELSALATGLMGGRPGFLVENKRYALAIHYRLAGAAAAGEVLPAFIKESEKLRRQFALELLEGKEILEVRPKGLHKGEPVSWLKKNFPGYFSAFLGDDTTDEDAFRDLKKNTGLGILVSEHPRPSNARLRLKSPAEVRQFLELLA
ncbi:MAG: trehalose-phosphatase [Bacillota bacterium]